jgi:uncharacterized protein (UPF0333 family)
MKMKTLRSLFKDSKGQSLTEFAVVLPLLILVVMGVLTLGLIIYVKMLVVISSSEAAKVGSQIMNDPAYTIEEKDNKIRQTALTFLSNGMTGTDRDVDVITDGDHIKVKVTYNYKLIFPFLSDVFADKTTIPISYESEYLIQ